MVHVNSIQVKVLCMARVSRLIKLLSINMHTKTKINNDKHINGSISILANSLHIYQYRRTNLHESYYLNYWSKLCMLSNYQLTHSRLSHILRSLLMLLLLPALLLLANLQTTIILWSIFYALAKVRACRPIGQCSI